MKISSSLLCLLLLIVSSCKGNRGQDEMPRPIHLPAVSPETPSTKKPDPVPENPPQVVPAPEVKLPTTPVAEVAQEKVEAPPVVPEIIPNTLIFKISRKVELEKDFSNFKKFGHNINKYSVTFEAESGHFTGAKVECTKKHPYYDDIIFSSSFDSRGHQASLVLALEENDKWSVDFDCKVYDKEIEIESRLITIKKSLYVDQKINMANIGIVGPTDFESLVIDEGGMLVSNGATIGLKVNEFISNKGRLVTYPKNTTAAKNTSGRSGGIIQLVAEKAMGELYVELRGENAGIQANVPAPVKTIPKADPSKDGRVGMCQAGIGNGKKGTDGQKGAKGLPGLNGGDSGKFDFLSIRENTMKMNVFYFPGIASDGGAGGKGGPGGPGGKAGEYRQQVYARTGGVQAIVTKCSEGARGSNGADGEPGARGVNGKNLPSTVEYEYEHLTFNFGQNWINF